jgi:hypothetical protein
MQKEGIRGLPYMVQGEKRNVVVSIGGRDDGGAGNKCFFLSLNHFFLLSFSFFLFLSFFFFFLLLSHLLFNPFLLTSTGSRQKKGCYGCFWC